MDEISAQEILDGIARSKVEGHIQDNVILCLALAERALRERQTPDMSEWLRGHGVSDKDAGALAESLKVFLR